MTASISAASSARRASTAAATVREACVSGPDGEAWSCGEAMGACYVRGEMHAARHFPGTIAKR